MIFNRLQQFRLCTLLAHFFSARAFLFRPPSETSRLRADSINAQRIPLESFETSACFMLLPAISVINFYGAGDDDAMDDIVNELKSRVDTMISLNPWLAGSLEKAPPAQPHEYELVVRPDTPNTSEVLRPIFTVASSASEFCSSSPWEDIASATERYVVRMGRECVATREPLFRISTIPLAASSKSFDGIQTESSFSVVVSMSHILGDGALLYQLIGMLGNSGHARALNPIRQPYKRPPWEAWCSKRVLTGCLARTVFGPRKRVAWTRVSRSWIDGKKAEATNEAKPQDSEDESSLWVSTNDVITSFLIDRGNYGRAYMAVDLRGRLGNALSNTDAGNYESAVTLPRAECGSQPFAVRRCLSEFNRRREDPYAHQNSLLACLASRQLFVTNWATVHEPMDLLNCRQVLHLPLLDPTAGQRGTAIIFAPTDGEIALLIADSNPSAMQAILSEFSVACDV